jgi:hypothetical protein
MFQTTKKPVTEKIDTYHEQNGKGPFDTVSLSPKQRKRIHMQLNKENGK